MTKSSTTTPRVRGKRSLTLKGLLQASNVLDYSTRLSLIKVLDSSLAGEGWKPAGDWVIEIFPSGGMKASIRVSKDLSNSMRISVELTSAGKIGQKRS